MKTSKKPQTTTPVIPQNCGVKAVHSADEIAGTRGVSIAMFGSGDFSTNDDIPLELSGEPDPRFIEAMGKFTAATAKYNRPLFG
jgi:4-hydroxy-2-oxoheptanedioate aldolase